MPNPASPNSLPPEIIKEICLQLCLPKAHVPNNLSTQHPTRVVARSASCLGAVSLISRIWRRPAQDPMDRYLAVNTVDKIIRFTDHLTCGISLDPTFADRPVALDIEMWLYFDVGDRTITESEESNGIASHAIVMILALCRNLRFLSIPIPCPTLSASFQSAICRLRQVRIVHLHCRNIMDMFEKRFGGSAPLRDFVDCLELPWNTGLRSFKIADFGGEHEDPITVSVRLSPAGEQVEV